MHIFARLAAMILFSAAAALAADKDQFALKSGDKVLFYGDSITEQRMYSTIVETYIATRYPDLDISFVNSGWGGDRVDGGGGGSIDKRLDRDVFPYKPSVITIMLGMNDGNYRAETADNDEKYFAGYRHIVESMKSTLPGVRITLLEPSPYDDVAHSPGFPVTGDIHYNEVMRSFGKWIADYAQKNQLTIADLNTNLVDTLTHAAAIDPVVARQILPDRVHPSFAGHMVMAEQLLKAWGARPLVSSVTLTASGKGLKLDDSSFTKVTELSAGPTLAWTESDDSLPLPFKQWQEMWGAGPTVDLVIKSSDVAAALNQQILKIKGLKPGSYSIKIDGNSVATFNNDQLAEGVNLALLKTPATDQAMKVYQLAQSREEIHFDEWRNIQVPLIDYNLAQSNSAQDSLNQLDTAVAQKMHELARPSAHKFEVAVVQ